MSRVSALPTCTAVPSGKTISAHFPSGHLEDDGTGRWFLNHYECPCGEEWSNEDDCTCDDRCPKCNAECEPTESDELDPETGIPLEILS